MSVADFSSLTGWLLFAWLLGFGGGLVYSTFRRIGEISS